jgi:hypothetical protein
MEEAPHTHAAAVVVFGVVVKVLCPPDAFEEIIEQKAP